MKRSLGLWAMASLTGLACASSQIATHEKPRASRTVGAGAHGGLAPEPRAIESSEIQALQTADASAVRRCYDRHRAVPIEGASETFEISLEIAADGRVERAGIAGDAPPELVSCIVALLRAWRFRPVGGQGLRISFPLSFAPPPSESRPGRPIRDAEVEALQRQHEQAFLACLGQAVERQVAVGEVEVWVTLLVGPSGTVESAEASGGWDVTFERCLAHQLRGWRFAPLGGSAPAQVRFPMQFRGRRRHPRE
jgi:hypothetical protein